MVSPGHMYLSYREEPLSVLSQNLYIFTKFIHFERGTSRHTLPHTLCKGMDCRTLDSRLMAQHKDYEAVPVP